MNRSVGAKNRDIFLHETNFRTSRAKKIRYLEKNKTKNLKRSNAKRTKKKNQKTKQIKPNTLKKMFDFDENQTGNPVLNHHSYYFDHFTVICSLQCYVKRLIEGSDLIGLNTELTVV